MAYSYNIYDEEDEDQKAGTSLTGKIQQTLGVQQPKTADTRQPTSTSQPAIAPQTQTFSQLQAQGYARPAPPPNYGPTGYQQPMSRPAVQFPNQGGIEIGDAQPWQPMVHPPQGQQPPQQPQFNLEDYLTGIAQNPSAFDDQVGMNLFNRLKQGVDEDFGLKRQYLAEEMARRGIDSSTIHSGRLGDLLTQHDRTLGNMATDISTQRAQTFGQDRYNALQQLMGYGQNQFQNQFQTEQYNSGLDMQNLMMWLQILGGLG